MERESRFLVHNAKFFVLNAMYKIDGNASAPIKFLLYFWRIACCSLVLSCIISSSMFIRNSSNEAFEKYAMNYMLTCIYFGCFARQVYYYTFDGVTHELIVKTNLVFKYESRSEIKRFTVERYVKRVYYMTNFWMLYTTFNVMFMNLASLSSKGRSLPFNLWYPYDWKVSPFYEISMFHQTISQLVMSSTYGNADLFFICSVFLLAGQFDLLGFEFGNVFYKVLLKHGISEEEVFLFKQSCGNCTRADNRQVTKFPSTRRGFPEIYDVVYSKKFNDDLLAAFGELISFHQDLLSLCEDFKAFFDPLQVFNFLIYVVYIPFMAFILATSKDRSLSASCGEYLVAGCLQLYLMTYFAQVLTTQTEQLPYDLYELPWHMCGRKFQTVFRFVHLRVLKPVQLSIGKFGTVSLNAFLMTLKTSFSYFTVLRQFAQEQ